MPVQSKKQGVKKSHWILVQVHEFDNINGEQTNHICTFQIKRNNLKDVKKMLQTAFDKENLF